MTDNTKPWVTELKLSDAGKTLHVSFDTGESYSLTAELLRVESPSAEVQGHGPDQKVCVDGKKNVAIIKIDPIGNYAVRLTFDDMHSTGIYSWDYFLRTGRNEEEIWNGYLDRLKAEGKTR